MSWELDTPFDSGQLTALRAGKHVIYVAPPAGWAVRPLFQALDPGTGSSHPDTLVLAPTQQDTIDIAGALRGLPGLDFVYALTGIARASGLLQRQCVRTLVATPPDAIELVRQSRLKLASLERVAVAWPSAADREQADALDAILGECPDAQRLVVTEDERTIEDFVERHAHRAATLPASRLPAEPSGGVRCVVVADSSKPDAVRSALDVLDPETVLLWEPVSERRARLAPLGSVPGVDHLAESSAGASLAIALDLPSHQVLSRLVSVAREVVVFVRAAQLGYLERLANPIRVLRLPGPVERARDHLSEARREIRTRIGQMDPTAALVALEPLFDEFDPALVAAALLAREAPGDAEPVSEQRSAPATETRGSTRLWLSVGRRDHVGPGDIVGALINAVGLGRSDIGRVDIRDGYSLVEVPAERAPGTIDRLAGVTLRGKRVSARLDAR